MKTEVLQPDEQAIQKAAALLREGDLVGMPTETVYGLAANALNPAALLKIFKAKGRPQDNPLIVHISDLSMLDGLVSRLPTIAKSLAQAYWPGPLTMILPKGKQIPYEATAGLESVGIRFPSHPVAQKLIAAAGLPLAAPSANLSGKPSPTTAAHVYEDLNGKIPLILDGGECSVGLESTVIAVGEESVRLLRPGGITVEMLERFCPVEVDDAVCHQLKQGAVAASPGMKYKHYSPKAHVVILDGTLEQFCTYLSAHKQKNTYALVFDGEQQELGVPSLTYGGNAQEQAKELFAALRKLDELGAGVVYARCPDRSGMGLAVYNRLIRAAGFEIISL